MVEPNAQPSVEPFIALNLEGVGITPFDSFKAVIDWVQSERDFWSFLQDYQVYPSVNEYYGAFNRCTKEILARAKDANSKSEESLILHAIEGLKESAQKAYSTERLLNSKSPRGRLVSQLLENSAEEAACMTAFFKLGKLTHFEGAEFRAALRAFLFEIGVESPTEITSVALEEHLAAWASQLEHTTDQFNERCKSLDQELKEEETARAARKTEFDTWFDSTKKEVEEFKKFYKEDVSLLAPVAYWTEVADSHRSSSRFFATTAILVSVVGLTIILMLANYLSLPLSFRDGEYSDIAFALLVTSFLVWAVRLLVQQFLSHKNLNSDASQRVTMANTFLALRDDDKLANSKDLQLVLEALFRPPPSGLKNDEQPPPVLLFQSLRETRIK